MSRFLFGSIRPPIVRNDEETRRVLDLARNAAAGTAPPHFERNVACNASVRLRIDADQAEPAVGERNSRAVSSMSQICASTAVTSRSKWGVLGLIRRPYVMTAFSRVTGSPAIERVRTALLAIVAAATVSTKCRNSSSVIEPISFDAGAGCTESLDEGKR